MESNIGRVVLGVVAVAAAAVLLVVLSSGDDESGGEEGAGSDPAARVSKPAGSDEGAEPTLPTIVVRGGKPVGGVEELDFEAGEEVRFAVRSDAPDELHVHGYDVERQLPAGRTVRIEFPADIEGVFEAELHESGEQIAELRVNP